MTSGSSRTYLFGTPMPDDPDAVSANMPYWAQVVGYEKGDPAYIGRMGFGYPRFFLHQAYRDLCKRYAHHAGSDEEVRVFPSLTVARKARDYVGAGRIVPINSTLALAIVAKSDAEKIQQFWQHTGLIVSSRQARNTLNGTPPVASVHQELRERIAALNNADPADVYLFPTGMAAIFAAHEAVALRRGTRTAQIGFPYVDSRRIQERFARKGDYTFFRYTAPGDFAAFRDYAETEYIAAVLCEMPSNPNGYTLPADGMKEIVDRKGFPWIIDDTLGPQCNINLSPYADVRATSLTKFFSGAGNVMGGSLVLSRHSRHYDLFKSYLEEHHEELLYPDDAKVLLENSRDFEARMRRINANALKLGEVLRRHRAIDRVFDTQDDANYEAIRQPNGGYGGLKSFTLKQPARAPNVYDALGIQKGPGLGNNFTSACPTTLLAHWNELPLAAQNGVPEELIRVSVGIEENFDPICATFDESLNQALPPRPARKPARPRRHEPQR